MDIPLIFVLIIIFIIIIGLIFLSLSFFIFPQLSPIPYFPSNKKDLPLIINALKLTNNQTIIDLGAGDGAVIFEAAKTAFQKELNTRFIALEINPVLIFILLLKRLFHPNKKNIAVIWQDMFKTKFRVKSEKVKVKRDKSGSIEPITIGQHNKITIYLYISPWYLDKVIGNLKSEIKNFQVLSYMYPIKSEKPYQIIKGVSSIYVYHFNKRWFCQKNENCFSNDSSFTLL